MANITINKGSTVAFSAVLDKDTSDVFNDATSIRKIGVVISGEGSTVVLRDTEDTDTQVFTAFELPAKTPFPGKDGYLGFSYTFPVEGRYDVKVCFINENDTLLNSDDDTIDEVFSKVSDDRLTEILKVYAKVIAGTESFVYDDKITLEILEDKKVV